MAWPRLLADIFVKVVCPRTVGPRQGGREMHMCLHYWAANEPKEGPAASSASGATETKGRDSGCEAKALSGHVLSQLRL